MTTDRTAAPARSTALERSPAAGRNAAPPTDAFSALLGAVAPRTEEAPRKAPDRRDDAPRADRLQRDDAPRREADDATTTAPAADEATTPVPAAETAPDDAPRLVTPEFFLQLGSPLPPAAPPAPAPAPPAATPALPAFAPTQLSISAAAQTAVPATGEAATATATATATAEPTAPVTATPVPTLPVLSGLTPASAIATDTAVAVTEQPAAPAQPQAAVPADVKATPDQAAASAPSTGSQTQSDAQSQEQPNTAAPAAAAVSHAKPADAPVVATAPTAQPIAAPAAPAAPVTPAPTGLERAVPLYRAVETTATLLHVATERGVTHARLNLKPVELGGIEVRLQSTPQGITAQLVADSPEAARMLVQAGDDLRRQLAERDVTLLSLDVSTSSDQRHQAAAGGADGFGDNYRPGAGNYGRTGATESTDAAPAPAETTLVLPGGVLVDVLA